MIYVNTGLHVWYNKDGYVTKYKGVVITHRSYNDVMNIIEQFRYIDEVWFNCGAID